MLIVGRGEGNARHRVGPESRKRQRRTKTNRRGKSSHSGGVCGTLWGGGGRGGWVGGGRGAGHGVALLNQKFCREKKKKKKKKKKKSSVRK